MTIFSRITDIINANINALLERAEDPAKMIRLMIQEMEDTLVEVRSQSVRTIADKREIERKIERLETSGREWEDKAAFALGKGREDLAKSALLVKRKLEDQAVLLREELEVIEASLARHSEDLSRLQAKIDEAKARRDSIELRMKTAKGRVRVKEALHDGRVDDALQRFGSLERRIDELEAGAEVYDMGKAKTLEQEFADLEVDSDVTEDLAKLKARVAAESDR
ncbi:MAG: phage shock protein PspA [Thiotrichales bacterium]|nr:phage shock protein PspA [Thiotrichales bacterium]MCY4283910.1 phage shock protein PspA [Thiotrichales bacterium]MCY4350159.1 phage shock protein PspA [Thiotrichales bacterium]